MSDHIQDDELERDESESEDTDDDDVDRAPQPGNTPAPNEPPGETGAITSRDNEDD